MRTIEPIAKVRDCHSRENGTRSEAPALSSLFKNFWTPAFAGVTPIIKFCNCLNILNKFNWLTFIIFYGLYYLLISMSLRIILSEGDKNETKIYNYKR